MSLVSGSELNILMEQLEVRTLIYCEIKHLYFALGLNLTKHDRWNWTFFQSDCDFLQSLAMAHQTQSQSEHNNTMITNPWLDPDQYRKFL